ncbi:alkaline protease secretion protein AprE [Rhodopirellula maiorica SM1]|uniref:Alkaline protease secretion protein AprE n=1 Tax=Rhodopirellula maiorica SM1 TaxID=1265738 RepID=M5RBN0_9BACT|nr:HlyD family efflux transporter periplasmic adaptor subunit [Rhodopirellula maiorica]EMI16888.1 alkaline protease secretion protein AprE [Rhodopirellula maiorica SM1]
MNAPSTRESHRSSLNRGERLADNEPRLLLTSIAKRCSDRNEFIRQLAQHLQSEFAVGVVAIVALDHEHPMMLVADEQLGSHIDRGAIRQNLEMATSTPTASDIGLLDSDASRSAPSSEDNTSLSVRGFRVELMSAPHRLAVLLVHRIGHRPTAAEQLETLRRLNAYVQSVSQFDRNGNTWQRSTVDTAVDSSRGDIPTRSASESLANANTSSNVTPLRQTGNESPSQRSALLQLHRSLSVHRTAYAIANESRRLIGCDRTVVLTRRGKHYRVRAVSGVAVVDKRSNATRCIERLVQKATVLPRPVMLPDSELLPPQIQAPLDEYLDQCGTTSAALLPLRVAEEQADDVSSDDLLDDPFSCQGEIVGVLLAEYFNGEGPESITATMQLVVNDSAVALKNAMEHDSIFALTLWKAIGRVKRSSKWIWITTAMASTLMVAIASLFIQVDHYVIATGSLEPTQRRHVFAAVDGVVKTLHVVDGQPVTSAFPLLELENADLQRNSETIAGQIQTTLQRLASIKAVRLSGDAQQNPSDRMAVEQQQLETELANLRSQLSIIESQQADLIVKSPIRGTVVGWQLEQRLARRPVSRGNLLLSVVDETGPWELKLQIPDRDAGAMLESFEQTPALPVTFVVATQPDRSYAATLHNVATAARIDEREQAVIDTTARVLRTSDPQSSTDVFDPLDVRIGADVTARVYCGHRSLLRSWFSDIFDFVNRKVLFYFR